MKFSISSCNKYHQCPRLYWIEKIEGYRDTGRKPWLVFGSNFDKLMEHVDQIGVMEALKKVDKMFKDPYEAANAEYLLLKWQQKFEDDPQPVASLEGTSGNQYELNIDISHMVEDKFELIFTGFIDKAFDGPDGLSVCERKTTKDVINPSSAYWNRLLFDPQIIGYCWGLGYEYDMPVSHVSYEVFRKPHYEMDKTLFFRDKDPDKYRDRLLKSVDKRVARDAEMVARKSFHASEELKDQWLFEFVNTAEEIHEKTLLMEGMDRPEQEFTRHKDACDLYLPCAYKRFCGCQCELEHLEYVEKK